MKRIIIKMGSEAFSLLFMILGLLISFSAFFMPDSFKYIDGIPMRDNFTTIFNIWAFAGMLLFTVAALRTFYVVGEKTFDLIVGKDKNDTE